jgi:hypothetical protein
VYIHTGGILNGAQKDSLYIEQIYYYANGGNLNSTLATATTNDGFTLNIFNERIPASIQIDKTINPANNYDSAHGQATFLFKVQQMTVVAERDLSPTGAEWVKEITINDAVTGKGTALLDDLDWGFLYKITELDTQRYDQAPPRIQGDFAYPNYDSVIDLRDVSKLADKDENGVYDPITIEFYNKKILNNYFSDTSVTTNEFSYEAPAFGAEGDEVKLYSVYFVRSTNPQNYVYSSEPEDAFATLTTTQNGILNLNVLTGITDDEWVDLVDGNWQIYWSSGTSDTFSAATTVKSDSAIVVIPQDMPQDTYRLVYIRGDALNNPVYETYIPNFPKAVDPNPLLQASLTWQEWMGLVKGKWQISYDNEQWITYNVNYTVTGSATIRIVPNNDRL